MNKRDRKALSQVPAGYEVGKGRPPKGSQWKPGQSGNLSGRPPGSKNKPAGLSDFAQDCVAITLAEGGRLMTVPDGDDTLDISLFQLNMRRLGLEGAKGRTRASRDFIDFVMAANAEESRLRAEAVAAALEYKRAWAQDRERCRNLHLPWKAPFPHPDQVQVDLRRMSVRIVGPASRAEVPFWREMAELLPEFEDDRREFEAKLAVPGCPSRRRLEARLAEAEAAIAFIEEGARFVADLDAIRKAAQQRRSGSGDGSRSPRSRKGRQGTS